MFDVDFLVQGYPGTSSTHGGLGWSTIALLSYADQKIIVDGGSFGVRKLLLQKLAERGVKPEDISMVLLTHSHWDHSVNWTLFPNATIVLSRVDMEWAIQEPPGGWHVPELYIRDLAKSSQLRLIEHEEEIVPGIAAHLVAGHTPGHVAFYVQDEIHDWVFAGDAAKNKAELLSHTVDMTIDEQASRASISYLWTLWTQRPGTVFVPGHDLPMILKEGKPEYIGTREARIEAWFGQDLTDVTRISLDQTKLD